MQRAVNDRNRIKISSSNFTKKKKMKYLFCDMELEYPLTGGFDGEKCK